jgi:hypothetical protein
LIARLTLFSHVLTDFDLTFFGVPYLLDKNLSIYFLLLDFSKVFFLLSSQYLLRFLPLILDLVPIHVELPSLYLSLDSLFFLSFHLDFSINLCLPPKLHHLLNLLSLLIIFPLDPDMLLLQQFYSIPHLSQFILCLFLELPVLVHFNTDGVQLLLVINMSSGLLPLLIMHTCVA